jgi:hypothetical protein
MEIIPRSRFFQAEVEEPVVSGCMVMGMIRIALFIDTSNI